MDSKAKRTSSKAQAQELITPTINHTIIRTLGEPAATEEGLGVRDLASATSLSQSTVKTHLFSLMVAGIVSFDEGSLYKLTEAGKNLLEDIAA